MSQPASQLQEASFERFLQEAAAGSLQEKDQILDRWRGSLCQLARQLLSGDLRAKADPEDLVQETFERALVKFAQFRGDSLPELPGWLRQILGTLVANFRQRNHRRRREVKREVPLDGSKEAEDELRRELPAATPAPDQEMERAEEEARLLQAYGTLPEILRSTVGLHLFENLTFAEIGARLDCKEEAPQKRYQRGIRELARRLGASS